LSRAPASSRLLLPEVEVRTLETRIDHAALFALLSSLADNKQAIGRQYASWCSGAPALEAAVAAAAMAQDELGHARTLYPLLADFAQADPAQVMPTTRTLHYHLAAFDSGPGGWSDFVALNFLFDTALTTFFEAAQDSHYEPLGQRARKIVQEERTHFVYGAGWVRRLAGVGGAVRSALAAALLTLWDETLCWFGPDDDPYMLQLHHEEVIAVTPAQLRTRYLGTIMLVLSKLEIAVPAAFDETTRTWKLTRPLPWSSWDTESRRLRAVS